MLESINYLPWISGAAQPKLTKDRLLSIPMAVPPPAEQEHIVNTIEERTAQLNSTIDRAKKEVQFLLELRARLVSDVVTGKVDVRVISANYPPLEEEVSDKPEGLLEDDDLADESETEEVEA
jgi:type I restriction enzyme S subunit